jgi:phytoene synthase
MLTTSPAWESRLLAMAQEALDGHNAASPPHEPARVSQPILDEAYHLAEELTAANSRTFFMASRLLPPAKRLAVRALYAFCRTSDDLVDHAHETHTGRAQLDDWQRRSLTARPALDDPIALAWADTRLRFGIPRRYAEQLIEGVARDLDQSRYETFEDLSAYCYGVASTVGLMAMYIIGFSGPEALPYALKLGVALQLTNILRDVGEDWQQGRFYLPLEELEDFGLSEADLAAGRTHARWQAFLSFQIERTRALYHQSLPGIAALHPDGRFAIAAAARLYAAILDDIEAHAGDVFTRRAYVSTWGKVRRLPQIWWLSRQARLPGLTDEQVNL